MLSQPASVSSVLALVTTFHLSLAALRNHRSPSSLPVGSLALVALSLAALPWLFPSAMGLVFGVGVHLLWFATCEYLAPALPRAGGAPSQVPSRPLPAEAKSASASRPAGQPRQPTSRGFLQVPVLATFDETPTIKTIRVARPDGFGFAAGQFMPVRVRVDGQELTRCYSISSAPAAQGYLEISVRRQGTVSNALHATARPGSWLSIRQPAGAFIFPAGDDRPIVLIAGGIGVTPLMSMLRHGVLMEPARPITLIYSAHTEADFAFRDELECLARRHPQFLLQLAAAAGPASSGLHRGRIDAELLGTTVPNLAHSISFICGPAAMIESMKGILGTAGVPPSQIRHEVFEAAVAAAGDAPPRPVRVAGRGAAHRVSCARSQRVFDVRQDQTLLEGAEAAGVNLPSLCRAGVCGTCRVRVSKGAVDCESSALDPDEVDAGFVLACVATVRADCEADV
jgi:ferredoxin-NADP reductase